MSWTPQMIHELQETGNRELCTIEVWLDSILEGYITESIVNTNKYYNRAKREFFNGPRGRFLLSLQFLIKMLVCEKGILKMHLE